MKKKIKIKNMLVAGFLIAIATTTLYHGSIKSMDFQQPVAYTSAEVSQEPQQSDDAETTEKDEAILYSSYITYGQGSVFVTVEKDTTDTKQEQTDLDNVDNLEEMDATEAPADTEETASPESADAEEQSGDTMDNTGIVSSRNLIDACFTEEEKTAIEGGEHKELKITFHNAAENEMKKTDVSVMNEALEDYSESMPGLSFGNYVQILIEKKNAETGKWDTITNFQEKLEITLDIQKDYQTAGATYYLIALKDDTYELLEDQDSYMETLTCSIDGSYAYGLCCEEKVQEDVATPAPTKQPSFVKQIFTDKLCLWHYFLVGTFVIGLTWVLAINSKKKRRIFLILIDILCIAMAVIGKCKWDWIIAIPAVVILSLLHVLRCRKK